MREGGVAAWKSTHNLCASAPTVTKGALASSNERRGTCGAPHISPKTSNSDNQTLKLLFV